MALKKPSELFGKKGDNSKISENINGNLNNIKQQFDKVEELKRELEGVTNSIDNSLSEVVDNSINFVEFKEEYSEEIDKLNTKIQGIKEDFDDKIDELRAAHLTLNTEITILDKRQNSLHIRGLKDEVIEELQNILNGNVYQNIRSLEEKFDSINEKQLQNLQEGLLNEPPNVDNSDPLTPLDKKYVTLDEFQEQYKLFINRIQKQLSTFGGGGAVRIQDLDDVDISTAKVNNKFLKYNSTSGKWEGADASGGGGGGSGITTEFVSAQTLNVVGVTTFNQDVNFPGAAYNIHWDQPTSKLKFDDSAQCVFGSASGGDLKIFHQSGNSSIRNETGQFRIAGNDIRIQTQNHSEDYIICTDGADVKLFFNDNEKFATLGTGATVTGDLHVSGDLFVSDDIVLDSLTGNFLNITGLSTFVGDAQFNGNVSIAGTLTYEDVTNIDSVGVVTARSGVRINSGGLVVSSGVATFTSAIDANGGANISGGLVANSLQVSDLTSGRVVLAGASGELEDSTNLTFNGSLLTVTGNHTVTGTLTAGLIDGGSF